MWTSFLFVMIFFFSLDSHSAAKKTYPKQITCSASKKMSFKERFGVTMVCASGHFFMDVVVIAREIKKSGLFTKGFIQKMKENPDFIYQLAVDIGTNQAPGFMERLGLDINSTVAKMASPAAKIIARKVVARLKSASPAVIKRISKPAGRLLKKIGGVASAVGLATKVIGAAAKAAVTVPLIVSCQDTIDEVMCKVSHKERMRRCPEKYLGKPSEGAGTEKRGFFTSTLEGFVHLCESNSLFFALWQKKGKRPELNIKSLVKDGMM